MRGLRSEAPNSACLPTVRARARAPLHALYGKGRVAPEERREDERDVLGAAASPDRRPEDSFADAASTDILASSRLLDLKVGASTN